MLMETHSNWISALFIIDQALHLQWNQGSLNCSSILTQLKALFFKQSKQAYVFNYTLFSKARKSKVVQDAHNYFFFYFKDFDTQLSYLYLKEIEYDFKYQRFRL